MQNPENSRSCVAKGSQYFTTASPLVALTLEPSGFCNHRVKGRPLHRPWGNDRIFISNLAVTEPRPTKTIFMDVAIGLECGAGLCSVNTIKGCFYNSDWRAAACRLAADSRLAASLFFSMLTSPPSTYSTALTSQKWTHWGLPSQRSHLATFLSMAL